MASIGSKLETTPVLYGSVTGNVDYFEVTGPPTSATTLKDNLTNPNPSTIQQDQAIEVHFEWSATGFGFDTIPGTWRRELLFERMGAAEGPATIVGAPVAHVVAWTNSYGPAAPATVIVPPIVIPAGYFPQGVYRMIMMLTLEISGGRTPVAAFVESDLFRVTHA